MKGGEEYLDDGVYGPIFAFEVLCGSERLSYQVNAAGTRLTSALRIDGSEFPFLAVFDRGDIAVVMQVQIKIVVADVSDKIFPFLNNFNSIFGRTSFLTFVEEYQLLVLRTHISVPSDGGVELSQAHDYLSKVIQGVRECSAFLRVELVNTSEMTPAQLSLLAMAPVGTA